jgi:hypothetical protein
LSVMGAASGPRISGFFSWASTDAPATAAPAPAVLMKDRLENLDAGLSDSVILFSKKSSVWTFAPERATTILR